MKIQLSGRAIPRNEKGDPAFERLQWDPGMEPRRDTAPQDVLEVFTRAEVVELVNRAIYQLEYQHTAHKVRGQRVRDAERLLRHKVKEMFHISWLKATPQQIQEAKNEIQRMEFIKQQEEG